MRTGLTLQQTEILNANVKKVSWLFEIDRDNDGTVDYYWSLSSRAWNGHDYVYKITSFTPLVMSMGNPEIGVIPPAKTTITASFSGNEIDGLGSRDFEGASVTIRLVCEARIGAEKQEAQIMAFRFLVVSAWAVDQILTLECQDWFTLHLEGDYPNTPLVSDLFRADIMKNDNVCVPLAFGTPFFPIRWINSSREAIYVDAATFTVGGDWAALFSSGRFVLAQCGEDGTKACWVQNSSYTSGTTTVILSADSPGLTANLTRVSTDHYLLGPAAGKSYTIDRARTPQEVNFKTTYMASDYIFKQDSLVGSDGVSYQVMQLLCDDANKDNINDANGFWGIIGKEIYDLPCRLSRSDLADTTNPADIAKWIFQDIGIPSCEIDDTSRAEAAAIFSARGLDLNVGLWYRTSREKLISKLFTIAGMIPLYRDKIGFKVLTTESQMAIEEDLIKPGSFQISRTFTQKEKDSGYVTWQVSTDPVDQVNKSLIAAKTTTNNYSDTTIEAEWILDAAKAQKAGKLALQRILLKDRTITFTAQGKFLALEPGDMITIEPANFGAEKTAYDCLITKITIHEGLWVDVECTRFSDSLDDWDDLAASDIEVQQTCTDRCYSPIYQGPKDAVVSAASAEQSNRITATVLIGEGGILATNDNPESNGGFQATNSELTCFNTSGQVRFKAVYAGDNQGDVELGDYTGGQGIKWDQSQGMLSVKVLSNGGITVSGGGDIFLAGSDTDPGRIKFAGTNYAVEIGGDADGNRFLIKPDVNNAVDFHAGINGAWWGEPDARFRDIRLYATRQGFLSCGDWAGAVNGAAVEVDGDSSDSEPAITFTLYDKTSQTLCQYHVRHGYFRPLNHKLQDLGGPSAAWDDAYANDWHNVADFFFLDHRRVQGAVSPCGIPVAGGALIPVDDIEVIKAIKPSGVFDPKTGLELIDDNTLPEWLLSKDKVSGKALYDKEGKPYLSLKALISLCLGAIRQLDRKIEAGKGSKQGRGVNREGE